VSSGVWNGVAGFGGTIDASGTVACDAKATDE
jgi:hypothetical protein